MDRAIVILVLVIFLLSYSGTTAMGSEHNHVIISNRNNQTLFFSLRVNNGQWGEYNIDAGSRSSFVCKDCEPHYFEFRMNTKDGGVHYRLDVGQEYHLKWNSERSRWDLFSPR